MNVGSGRDPESGAPEAAPAAHAGGPPAYPAEKVSHPIFERLREVQQRLGHLPHDELEKVAADLPRPLHVSEVHAAASFYPHFYIKSQPQPKVQVRICCDMSCHLRGAGPLFAAVKQRLTGMEDVSVQEVSCLGQCDGAPAMTVNDLVYRDVDVDQAEKLSLAVRRDEPEPENHPVAPASPLGSDPYQGGERYGALRKVAGLRNWDEVVPTLQDAGLRGLGGAGFPAFIKWTTVKKEISPVKYVICNADESEPGTIKDRFILTYLPHLVIEGMIIGGLVTGAKNGVLYIRHEYAAQERILHHEIQQCREAGLLGPNVAGSGRAFELELYVSPGGYICGEESALIEAIEGKRGEPRNKPSIPAKAGLYQQPTLLNNVETFANVPQILERGAEWYKTQGQGRPEARGLKFVGISGDVEKPGIYEIPMGLPFSKVLETAGGVRGGKALKAFAPSGPSSGYLPASLKDVHLDFDSMTDAKSMLGSGAIVVASEKRCMLDLALNAVKFFRRESCGKCVPCRVGTRKLEDMLAGWTRGQGTRDELKLLDEVTEALKFASICGLGQFAHSPITSVREHFRDEIEAHVLRRQCLEGVCKMR